MRDTAPPKPSDVLIREGLQGWLMLYGIWAIPALMGAGVIYMGGYGQPDAPWWRPLVGQIGYYWFFATLCPPAYLLLGRFPLRTRQWWRSLPVYVLFATVVVLVLPLLDVTIDRLAGAASGPVLQAYLSEWRAPNAPFRSLIALFYCVVVWGAVSLVRISRFRKSETERRRQLELRTVELEAELNSARLAALRSQLRPHFLFNALNTVSALVQKGDADRTLKTVARLGDLLRASLDISEAQTIPLDRELELVDQYLGIERLRYSDRLKTTVEVDPECRQALVPAFVLQPLVENGLRHAVGASSGPCELTIRARRDNGQLRLQVSDTGPGFAATGDYERPGGVGLTNLRRRLNTLYGDRGRLRVRNGGREGACVQVDLPYTT